MSQEEKKCLWISIISIYGSKRWILHILKISHCVMTFQIRRICTGSMMLFNFKIKKFSMGKHSELIKFELKIYYIWRAALGKISKKTNNLSFSHHGIYLNTRILRAILLHCKFMAYFNSFIVHICNYLVY